MILSRSSSEFFCILFSAILAWNQSTGFVYAYYVLRTISYILSQGSIFCIAVAYAVRLVPQWLMIMNREYWGSHFPFLRIISFILSQGSIFCIAIAYAVRVIPQWLIIMNREYWGSHFPIFCRRMLLKRIRGQQLLVG